MVVMRSVRAPRRERRFIVVCPGVVVEDGRWRRRRSGDENGR